jgi:hypothetical protein
LSVNDSQISRVCDDATAFKTGIHIRTTNSRFPSMRAFIVVISAGASPRAFLLRLVLALSALLGCGVPAAAQSAQRTGNDGWRVTVYPVLAWVPTHINIDVNLPPDSGSGGGDGSEGGGGEIVDSRFDGAYLGGFVVANGTWRVDVDGLWAAVGGDRVERPRLTVDVDAIYGRAVVGRRLVSDLYLTGGVRRLALDYDIQLGDRPNFSRKPGVWNPLIGAGWHTERKHIEIHASVEGGGFGVGADSDIGGTFRVDLKPVGWFGITGGYSFLQFKVSEDVLGRTFEAKQTLHGPVVGVGLYF